MNEYFFSYNETYIYPNKNENIENTENINFYINNRFAKYKNLFEINNVLLIDDDEILAKYANPYFSIINMHKQLYDYVYYNNTLINKNIILMNPPILWDYIYMYGIYMLNTNTDRNIKINVISKSNEIMLLLTSHMRYNYVSYTESPFRDITKLKGSLSETLYYKQMNENKNILEN